MLKLFAKRPPTPVLDRTFGCSQARAARKQFKSANFAAVGKRLRKRRDTDQRSFLIDVLADSEDRPARFDQWVEEQPDCLEARLVSGAQALEWAWQARGFARGDDVSEQQWNEFTTRLEFAHGELEEAVKIDPADPISYGYLLRYALGSGWPLADATTVYGQATQQGTTPWLATFNYFTFLCEKWFGSHARMFEFARGVSENAPAGADVHAILAFAHIERWLFSAAFEDNPRADDYWLADDVFDELINLYKRWVNKTESSPYEKVAANAFLFCFASLSAREVMRVELERIGPFPSFTPWRYLGDPVAVYQNIWKLAHEK